MQTMTTALITLRDFTRLGFSQAEIQALETLRATYVPYREYCESNCEHKRLAFLKWRYEHGEFART